MKLKIIRNAAVLDIAAGLNTATAAGKDYNFAAVEPRTAVDRAEVEKRRAVGELVAGPGKNTENASKALRGSAGLDSALGLRHDLPQGMKLCRRKRCSHRVSHLQMPRIEQPLEQIDYPHSA